MSFFIASVPNNTLLYHGTHTQEPILGMEWLAFEIEHAEVFARTRGPGGPGRRPPGEGGPGDGGRRPPPGEGPRGYGPPPPFGETKHASGTAAEGDGYLHIYKTKKPLSKLLYLDGMSAGKTSMGTLDTQDYVLCNLSSGASPPGRGGPMGDFTRALQMCELGVEYGVEGIIRMEAGFELILCNFTTGLDLLQAVQRPKGNGDEAFNELGQFEYMRGISARYDGITAGRVKVDYSSMVSAFFYPLNLTNPDAEHSELPRLPVDDKVGLLRLKDDVLDEISITTGKEESVDWQGVVDMIISRYADRLQFLASNTSTQKAMLSEINFLLSVFIDYKNTDLDLAIEKCAAHYLLPITLSTKPDFLIHAAISTVSNKICSTLFDVRSLLLADGSEGEAATEKAKNEIKALIEYLDWSTWKRCGKCAYDEVCFVAIWPWGGVEDHFAPGCVKNDHLASRRGYWNFPNFGGGEPRREEL
jgi:hypothetical protein